MAGKANPRFEKALAFVAQAHAPCHQERKGTDFPYVAHPIGIAAILDPFECKEDVVVAGFIHDTTDQAFAAALELTNARANAITSSIVLGDVTLRLGWVKEC